MSSLRIYLIHLTEKRMTFHILTYSFPKTLLLFDNNFICEHDIKLQNNVVLSTY